MKMMELEKKYQIIPSEETLTQKDKYVLNYKWTLAIK